MKLTDLLQLAKRKDAAGVKVRGKVHHSFF